MQPDPTPLAMPAPGDAPAQPAHAEPAHAPEELDAPMDDAEEPYKPSLTLSIDSWTSPNHGHFTSLVARLEDKDAQVNVSTTSTLYHPAADAPPYCSSPFRRSTATS